MQNNKTYRPYLASLFCIGLAVWFFTMRMFGFMLLIFLPLLLITRAVKWWKARRDPQAKRLERFRLVAWTATVVFILGVNGHYQREARGEMAAIAAAIDRYHAQHGSYPQALADAGFHTHKSFEIRYGYQKDTQKHFLLYKDPLLPFEFYSYDFEHHRWLQDNGEPVRD